MKRSQGYRNDTRAVECFFMHQFTYIYCIILIQMTISVGNSLIVSHLFVFLSICLYFYTSTLSLLTYVSFDRCETCIFFLNNNSNVNISVREARIIEIFDSYLRNLVLLAYRN